MCLAAAALFERYLRVDDRTTSKKPIAMLPIVESTPLRTSFWENSRDKTACEDVLVDAYRKIGFPVTMS